MKSHQIYRTIIYPLCRLSKLLFVNFPLDLLSVMRSEKRYSPALHVNCFHWALRSLQSNIWSCQ